MEMSVGLASLMSFTWMSSSVVCWDELPEVIGVLWPGLFSGLTIDAVKKPVTQHRTKAMRMRTRTVLFTLYFLMRQ
jgi:hypothetical protein